MRATIKLPRPYRTNTVPIFCVRLLTDANALFIAVPSAVIVFTAVVCVVAMGKLYVFAVLKPEEESAKVTTTINDRLMPSLLVGVIVLIVAVNATFYIQLTVTAGFVADPATVIPAAAGMLNVYVVPTAGLAGSIPIMVPELVVALS